MEKVDTSRELARRFGEENRDLLLRRMRAGGACVMAGLVLFGIADWLHSPTALPGLYTLKGLMALQVGLLLWAVQRPWGRERAAMLAVVAVCSIYAFGTVQSTFVIRDVEAAPASFIIISICAAALLPWGATMQALTVVFGTAMLWLNAIVVDGTWVAAFGYLQVAALIGLSLSVYLAWLFARHRATLWRTEAELRRATEVNERFVAAMSHEVRNGIAVVMGYNDLLLEGVDGTLNPQQRRTAQRAWECAAEMLDVVAATLDLSRFDARGMTLDLQPVDLGELLAELEREVARPAAKPDLPLAWRVVRAGVLTTDRLKLKMILRNLVGNALKYTDRGSVLVQVSRIDDAAEVIVQDTGRGIPRAALPTLFDPFEQGHGGESRQRGGAGLGLHIARRLVDALGGTIDVESELGRGTTFRVWLPDAARSQRTSELPPRK